jgi:hypothetical protein
MMDELDESKSGRVTYEHFRKWWKAFVASQKETPLHRFKIAARKISQEIAAVNILRGPLASPARTPRDNLEELSAPYSARRDSAMSRLYMYARGAYQPHRSTAMHSPRGIDVEPMVERTGTSKRAAPGTRVLMPFHAPLRGTATTSSQHPFVSPPFLTLSPSHLLTDAVRLVRAPDDCAVRGRVPPCLGAFVTVNKPFTLAPARNYIHLTPPVVTVLPPTHIARIVCPPQSRDPGPYSPAAATNLTQSNRSQHNHNLNISGRSVESPLISSQSRRNRCVMFAASAAPRLDTHTHTSRTHTHSRTHTDPAASRARQEGARGTAGGPGAPNTAAR